MNKIIDFLLKVQVITGHIGVFLKKSRDFLLTLWLRGMQWLCMAFLLVYSQFIDVSFTVFCVVVMCAVGYALSVSKAYREADIQKKKLLRWASIVTITVVTAYLWAWLVPTEEIEKAVSNFAIAAIESGLIVACVEGVIKLMNKLQTKSKKNNKQVST